MVKIIKPVKKLLLKPKRRTGSSGATKAFNARVDAERARIDKVNKQLISSGRPVESFAGQSVQQRESLLRTIQTEQTSQRAQAEQRIVEAKQQKEFSQTIAGQVKSGPSVQPTTFSEFRPGEFGLGSGFRRGGFEAAGAFIGRIPEFVTGFGPALSRSLEGDSGGFRDIDPFKAFERVGPKKGERVVSFEPQFGSVSADQPTGFRPITGFSLLRQERRAAGIPELLIGSSPQVISGAIGEQVSRDVTSQFQARVDTGELTVAQAREQAGAQFQTSFSEQTRGLRGLGGEDLLIRRGERISGQVKGALPAAAVIGASLTPSIALVGLAGIGSAGISLVSGQESLEAFQRGDVGRGAFKLGEASLFGVGSAQLVSRAFGPAPSSLFETQIGAIRRSELERTPFSVGGVELGIGERGVVTKISLSKTTGVAAQEADVLIPTFAQGLTRGGQQRFSITGGKIVKSTRIQPASGLGDVLKFDDTLSFIGKGQAGIGGRLVGPASSVELGEGISTAIGKITIPKGGRAITSGFGGISRRGDEFINVVSGTPFKRTVGDISTFSLRPTTGGPIKISTKDIIDLSPSGSGIQSIASGGVGGITGGGVGGIQGVSLSQISGGLAPSEALATGGVQAGLTAAELTGVPVLRQAGIQGFLPTLRTSTARGGGLSFGTLDQAPQILQFGRQDFQSSLIRSPDLSSQLTTFDAPPQSRQIIGTGPSTSPGPLTSLGLRQLGDSGLRVGPASFLSGDLASIVGVIQRGEQRVDFKSRQQLELTQPFEPSVSSPFIRPTRGPFTEGFSPGFGFGFPVFGAFPEIRPPTKGKKRKRGRVAPSLTGLSLFDLGDITGGPLPKSGLPIARLVPEDLVGRRKTTKKKKKSSKKKK